MAEFTDDVAWSSVAHSSFDVAISEYLLESQAVTVADLAASPSDYKASTFFSNFATTLTLPQEIPVGTKLLHGGVFVQNWPTPECPRPTSPAWYPSRPLSSTTDTSMTLVISDFGDGAIDTFMASLNTAREAIDPTCNGGNQETLPFTAITVITQDQVTAGAYASTYPDVTFAVRDIGAPGDNFKGGAAWWDMCNADISDRWFMLTTSHFTLDADFKLAADLNASAGEYLPLIPYVLHDSIFCDRECRVEIEAQRRIYGGFNRHFGQEFAVFNTAIRNEYCALLRDTTANVGGYPSVDGYFAFMEREDAILAAVTVETCNSVADDLICGEPGMVRACIRDDAVGVSVREKCKVTCGTCTSTTLVPYVLARDPKPTYEWWERKSEAANSDAGKYQVYNREKLFTIGGFDGPPVAVVAPRGQRCEGGACECILPFFYQNVKYTACLDDGTNPPWCPTSVTNTQEYLESSDDWRECSAVFRDRRVNHFGDAIVRNARNVTDVPTPAPTPAPTPFDCAQYGGNGMFSTCTSHKDSVGAKICSFDQTTKECNFATPAPTPAPPTPTISADCRCPDGFTPADTSDKGACLTVALEAGFDTSTIGSSMTQFGDVVEDTDNFDKSRPQCGMHSHPPGSEFYALFYLPNAGVDQDLFLSQATDLCYKPVCTPVI
jgi:hypothetical protein